MTEGEHTRLVAWSSHLRAVHDRLREALEVTRAAIIDGGADEASRDLRLFCRAFCTALASHHEGEDRTVFPAVAAAHPELRETLRYLEQDHSMIAHLLTNLQQAAENAASQDELDRHLEGIAAIMESHFRYEERQLLTVLETLGLDADARDVLGPL